MAKSTKSQCPQCGVLAAKLTALMAEVARLREHLARAQKDSTTSSKPPSSDIVKPQPSDPTGEGLKRKIGGQPRHEQHIRELFSHEQITKFHTHPLDACPDCGGRLHHNASLAKVVQQIDIEAIPVTIAQHTGLEYWCDHCQKTCTGLPLSVQRGGLVGPNLTALIAFMKGYCHASFSTIRKFLHDVVGVEISRGMLSKTIGKVSQALEGTYEELAELLSLEDRLIVDETGHKNNGQRWWTWCLRAELYTLYKIDARRSADVLLELLGADFAGVIGCDYFSAYRRYMKVMGVEVQFCLAHLIRDVKFLTTLPDVGERAYGERLREALKHLFAVIHRSETMSAASFERELQAARALVLYQGLNDVPPTRAAQNMAKRFRKHGESYFTFVTTPGVEPTNNLAEQAIRFVVIDPLITQGTRSEAGRKWNERIWTVIATSGQQGRSVFKFVKRTIVNWLEGGEALSLVPEVGVC